MFEGKRIVALIPARGGSKGLPGKNVLPLCGKPLIGWTIEQAKLAAGMDKVIVTTDDEEIAATARAFGAGIPFMRPKHLASDTAKSFDVVIHALDWFEARGDRYDFFLLLQPTSPLRSVADIDNALQLLASKKAGAVISVCETDHHPYWSNTIPADGCMAGFLRPELTNKNRQELPVHYRLNGAIYAASCDYFRKQQGFFGPDSYAFIMPKERSVDIDTKIDFLFAELLLQQNTGYHV